MGQNAEMPENACRLCDESCTAMHSVFERSPEGQQILHIIKDCLRILIYRTDPLPKQVCESCYRNLLNFSSFKKITHETLERQIEKLRECNAEHNVSVRLFLTTLEQENYRSRDKRNLQKSHQPGSEPKPTDNNESELCAQLHRAIKESLQKSKIQENHTDEQDLTNGHAEILDEDSQTSSHDGDDRSPSCSQSDMELCESDNEHLPKIITTKLNGKRLLSEGHITGPASKKRKFVGPKTRVKQMRDNYLKLLHEHALKENKKRVVIKYNPLSLLGCVLYHINKRNVPDFVCDEPYTKSECEELADDPYSVGNTHVPSEENYCRYCSALFIDGNALAVHESTHMYVVLGQKVDEARTSWSEDGDDDNDKKNTLSVRNKWLNKKATDYLEEDETDNDNSVKAFEDSTGHVNIIDPQDVEFKEDSCNEQDSPASENKPHKDEVVLIDTKATVKGVPLSEIPKDNRRTLYRSVMVNGVKRKFCPLCRYTFKDNWAIESHYFSTACHYTCRFCGVRFNKQRHEFDNHIKTHIMAGDVHTTKIFASRKFHSVPKVINENKTKARAPPALRQLYTSKFKPKQEKRQLPHVEIKKELRSRSVSPVSSRENIENDGKSPQNQAYFCRKCYQVFFKLGEFNVHVVRCKGTPSSNAVVSTSAKYSTTEKPKSKSEPEKFEKFSPTGRPMRNCVKEVGTYVDEMPEEVEMTPLSAKKNLLGKSERGFECTMCSSCFPTVHSRNSHMRIHKSNIQLNALAKKSINIVRNRPENVAKKMAATMAERHDIPTFAKYVNNVKIKQEPMEPIVEIHEQSAPNNYPSSIGSVSITPIPNSSHKTTLDPNIMKLVQNNPNLTIKTMTDQMKKSGGNAQQQQQKNASPVDVSQGSDADGKCYRCLSCSKPFANKSNLYFHKKNQCSGSKYPCPFCKKRFGTEAAYSSHIFYNHPE